ncbi:ABC transporter permease [Geomonas sp. RF6]|uniref:MlaE family ABC transporter permease n=1 Tax=Geomonas sp. RF6 TaxID=2897342 RepID=UPI001E41FF93|nr:ABC transporter permease [Geomonas sp. RF6]UFS72878.1 ABC transporter permease [Geomonas sp. RF6]
MHPTELTIEKADDGTLLLTIAGDWQLTAMHPSADAVLSELAPGAPTKHVTFATAGLQRWGSGLLVFLARIFEACRKNSIAVDQSGLPSGVRKLLALAAPDNQRSGVTHGSARPPFLERVADLALNQVKGGKLLLAFLGEVTLAFLKMLRGKGDFRRLDLLVTVQETGAQALPIVTLISLLVGMILAFVAAIQLKLFGAQIYVADVVGIGVVRVMGAVMTGVIMSGRTGAAFAAQLGTMQVNEEIDALETLGFSSVEFLVLPRLLALMLMMPLLCVYSDLMGVIGGMIVGVGMLDLGVMEYINESQRALNLTHFLVGLFHSFVFGILVAVSGCLRGIQCERSASAVGYAATSAVVTSIVCIVIATAVITLSCQVLGL